MVDDMAEFSIRETLYVVIVIAQDRLNARREIIRTFPHLSFHRNKTYLLWLANNQKPVKRSKQSRRAQMINMNGFDMVGSVLEKLDMWVSSLRGGKRFESKQTV